MATTAENEARKQKTLEHLLSKVEGANGEGAVKYAMAYALVAGTLTSATA